MYRTADDDFMDDISFHSSLHEYSHHGVNSKHGLLSRNPEHTTKSVPPPIIKRKSNKTNKSDRSDVSTGFASFIYRIKRSFSACYEALCVPKTISIKDYRKEETASTKARPMFISGTASSLNIDNFRAALLSDTVSAAEVEKIFDDTRYHLFVDIGGSTLINPRSTFMLWWQTLNLLVTTISLLFVPVEVAFSRDEMGFSFLILGAIFECYFILDLIMNFNLPVQDKASGYVIGDRLKIFQYYIKFWFWIDLVSAIPFDILSIVIGNTQSYHTAILFASLKIVRVLKVSVMARVLRADLIVTNLQGYLAYSHETVQLVKLLFYMLVTIHSLACGLFLVAEIEQADINWLEMNSLVHAHVGTKYIVAVYWAAMTATTIGYGDIIMSTTIERVYSCGAMIIGASTYAYVTSRLVGMIIYGNRFKSRYSDIRSELLNLMRDIELPMVYRAIAGDFLFHWYHTRQKYDSHELLQTMSPQLRGLIAQHMHGEWIRTVSFLGGVLPSKANDLASFVALAVVHQMYMPGEYIIKHGDEFNALYVVDEGKLTRAGGGVVITLNRFDHFGEEMILTHPGRAGYVVVNGIRYSTLYILSKDSVFQLLQKFPELASQFRKARVRIAFRKRVKKLIRMLIKHRKRAESMGMSTTISSILSNDNMISYHSRRGMEITPSILRTSSRNTTTSISPATPPRDMVPDTFVSSSSALSVTSRTDSIDAMTGAVDGEMGQIKGEVLRLTNVLSDVSKNIANIHLRLEAMDATNILAIHTRSEAGTNSVGSEGGGGIAGAGGVYLRSSNVRSSSGGPVSSLSWRTAPHEEQTHK